MGRAGATLSGGDDTADSKTKNLKTAGVEVAASPADIGAAMPRALGLGDAIAA